MIKTVLITGANAGLGKEAAKQLALTPNIEKIVLACRNPEKGLAAIQELEQLTQKYVFELLTMDVSDLHSVRNAVKKLPFTVDALIMNAGGTGGKQFAEKTLDGVSQIFAVNLFGHTVLTQELIAADKLKQVALYAGSEAARGVEEMGMKRPNLPTSSESEFASIIDGSFFGKVSDATIPYGSIKYMGALWMSAMAKRHPAIKFITMSPGATTGTEGFDSLPVIKRWAMKGAMQMMLLFKKVHRVEQGAQRYLDGLFNADYQTGRFYASQKGLTGPVSDQATLFSDLSDTDIQENAYRAIQRYL